ncbi:MAG TPA: lysine--tRNA ligase, partial [Sutterella sp.]|nr:lysine--tRNA ligase [Sutterella sp.]
MSEEQKKVIEVEDENHIIAERRAKVLKWRESTTAYPNDFKRTDRFSEVRAAYG